MNNKPDVKYILEDTNGNKYTIIDTQRVDLQEELNKEIKKQAIEIKRLKEEYVMLQNASDKVEEEKDKEIKRLNNIINSIDTRLIEMGVDDDMLEVCKMYDVNGVELRKMIKELKGSDKE